MNPKLQLLRLLGERLMRMGKSSGMAALKAGDKAPVFKQPLLDGGEFYLSVALAQGPVVLAFFKVSCPVCQMAFPYYERMFDAYGAGAKLVGVSQNSAADTAKFAKAYSISFPIVLDETTKYPVSNAYGLTNVPTLFWISPDGMIEISSVSWEKGNFELIAERMSAGANLPGISMFSPGEQVPAFRPG